MFQIFRVIIKNQKMKFKFYQQEDDSINVVEVEAETKEEAIDQYFDIMEITFEEIK